MRLIDADALIDKTDDRYSLGEIGRRERDDIVNALEYAPTITAQPKTGKWINGHWDGDSNFRIDGRGNCWYVRECSNCHEEIKGKPTKYCPQLRRKDEGR